MRRTPVLLGLAAVLAGGAALDRVERPETPVVGTVGTEEMPVAAPASALSSTWYCAGGSGQADSAFHSFVTVANPGEEPITGSVTVVPEQGDPKVVPLSVPAFGSAGVAVADVLPAAYAAAFVDLDGGQAVVEHSISGRAGTATAPCASAASSRWYFADGATAKDATLALALYNPFPDDAIVDLAFSTDEGRAAPADFQGVVVPAGRLVVKDIGEHVRRREAIATEVVARSGRLVADQLQVRTAPGVAGVSLRLGAPAPGDVWYFPDGFAADGLVERYTVFNPGDREALVDVELTLDEGAAEPFELTVPPRERVTVVSNDEARVPKGVGHSAVVRSINGVPVVAERSVAAAPPSDRLGREDVRGARRTARQWAFAVGSASPSRDEWIVVHNPGPVDATFDVTGLADGQPLAIEGLQGVKLPAGRRVALRLGERVQRDVLPVVVRADRPVVAERALFAVGGPGLAGSVGIPLD
ncbi:MAG TPA: DUF5719 family protein [Acidimicrobiales bacterium]|nr:DUF5719 family protein [Acidimicrobiales bacterium]